VDDGLCLHLDALGAVDLSRHRLTRHWAAQTYPATARKTAIIIPSYEVLDCLIACIEAVRAYTPEYIDYELIIVDNCSSEVVTDFLKRLAQTYEDVTVILNEHNMGFTYAVNQGIKAARPDSDYVLLNNDAIVTPDWLDALYRVKDEIPEAGLIVPRQQLVPHRRTIRKHVPNCTTQREVDVNLSFWHGNIEDLHKYGKRQYVELNFAPFFLVLITKECFAKLGCLDEVNGRHYESDTLYCKAAREQGIAIVYTPYAKVYHLLQQATKDLKEHDSYMYDVIFKKNNWTDLGDNHSYEEENKVNGDN
jgi:GT2 family glycosyltransferase